MAELLANATVTRVTAHCDCGWAEWAVAAQGELARAEIDEKTAVHLTEPDHLLTVTTEAIEMYRS